MEKIQIEYVWVDGFTPQQLRSKIRILYVDTRRYSNLESFIGSTPRELREKDLNVIPVWYYDGSLLNQTTTTKLIPIKLYLDSNRYIALCDTQHESYRSIVNEKPTKTNIIINQEFAFLTLNRVSNKSHYNDVYGYGKNVIDEFINTCLTMGITIDSVEWTGDFAKLIYTIRENDTLSISDDIWMSRYILHKVSNKHKEKVSFDSDMVSKFSGFNLDLKMFIDFDGKMLVSKSSDNPYKIFSSEIRS